MSETDEFWYMRYTGKQQVEKALNVLRGLLMGISADATIDGPELQSVCAWVERNEPLMERKPFDEIRMYLKTALSDGILSSEEREDLMWLSDPVRLHSSFFNDATMNMQTLHGILKGIAADNVISKTELDFLRDWMVEQSELEVLWPYSELMSMVTKVLEDGMVDADEHRMLLGFFHAFVGDGLDNERVPGQLPMTIAGICEMGPEIIFDGMQFCFTGVCSRYTRRQLSDLVRSKGGEVCSGVCRELNYLVVCDNGNPAWAFSAYGRKVEKAMAYRKKGVPIRVVHESDFFDEFVE